MTIGWFIIFLLLLVVEFATVNLVTIWFAFGALVTVFLSFVVENIWVQSAVFVITSVIALLCTKPLLKAFHLSELIPTNTDRLIGKEGEVIKDIFFNEYGRVKVFGENWMATSEEPIKEGSKVIIKNIEGAKLIVEKKKEEK